MKRYQGLALATAILSLSSPKLAAVNLVVNGDFESLPVDPPIGFTSDYSKVPPASLVSESTYIVASNPSTHHGLFSSYFDHTLGTASGHMFIANGSGDTTKNVWQTAGSLAVTPDTDYFFEAFISSAHPAAPAILSFELDGDFSDATLGEGAAPAQTGVWLGVSKKWNSGQNTSVTLFLRNANSASFGNDFAIDDINFSVTSIVNPPVSAPESMSTGFVSVLSFGICLLMKARIGGASPKSPI